MNNLNYLGKDWLNIVFEGRNKLYGAYKLRQDNIKNSLTALIIGIGSLSLVFGGSFLYANNSGTNNVIPTEDTGRIIETTTIIEPKVEPKIEPKIEPKVEPTTTKKEVSSARTDVQKNIKMTQTNIVEDTKKTEQLASQNMFDNNTNSGVADADADTENGRLKTKGENTGLATSGEEGKNRKTTEITTTTEKVDDKIYMLSQNKAEPKEGFNKFYSNFTRKFTALDINTSANEITVRVKFVVEKDGSFSDIQIIDDKFGVGKEAERILKGMPKWKAAEHNGKTVRSMFTLPIKIRLK